MTQEDKELLLKDLCARLPYNCRVFYEYIDNLDNKTYGYSLTLNTWCIDEFIANKAVIKPYLRSISSMTEEEKFEQKSRMRHEGYFVNPLYFHTIEEFDYLNSIHVDYRGLIEKGFALEAPEDMYK